jgi:hypothetical protein
MFVDFFSVEDEERSVLQSLERMELERTSQWFQVLHYVGLLNSFGCMPFLSLFLFLLLSVSD